MNKKLVNDKWLWLLDVKKLNKLNSEFPDKLKSSILQEAIQGRLVPQNPNDEPASVLLEKIKDEKERLIKEKKSKETKMNLIFLKKTIIFMKKLVKKVTCLHWWWNSFWHSRYLGMV